MEDLYNTLKILVSDNPNDSVLGYKVRSMIRSMEELSIIKNNSNKRFNKQLDLEDVIKEIENENKHDK